MSAGLSTTGGWRVALRLARREALRRKGQTALMLVLICLPVLAVSASAIVWRTSDVTGAESIACSREWGLLPAVTLGLADLSAGGWLLNGWGDDLVHDYLKGIEIEGRLGVLYSNKDYGCEWDYDWRNKRFLAEDNTKFAVNIVLYALTA